MAPIEKSPPRGHSLRGIARSLRPPLLRLQQIDVAAPRDVERVSARTDEAALLALERQMAIANGA